MSAMRIFSELVASIFYNSSIERTALSVAITIGIFFLLTMAFTKRPLMVSLLDITATSSLLAINIALLAVTSLTLPQLALRTDVAAVPIVFGIITVITLYFSVSSINVGVHDRMCALVRYVMRDVTTVAIVAVTAVLLLLECVFFGILVHALLQSLWAGRSDKVLLVISYIFLLWLIHNISRWLGSHWTSAADCTLGLQLTTAEKELETADAKEITLGEEQVRVRSSDLSESTLSSLSRDVLHSPISWRPCPLPLIVYNLRWTVRRRPVSWQKLAWHKS